jgi:hypothetical protein
MASDGEVHEYHVTETVEHTVVSSRPLTGSEIKRAVDGIRAGAPPEAGIEITWNTSSRWGGLVLDARPEVERHQLPTRMVDAVDDSFD